MKVFSLQNIFDQKVFSVQNTLLVICGFAEVFHFAQGNFWHSEMKRKTSFSFAFPSFFRNFAAEI